MARLSLAKRYRRSRRRREALRETERRFRDDRAAHLCRYRPDPELAPDPQVLSDFARDGVTVVRRFVDDDVVAAIRAEVGPAIRAVADGTYTGPLRSRVSDGDLFRLYGVEHSLSPTSNEFFESQYLADLADAVCTVGMRSFDRYVDYKPTVGARDANVDYHIDHWKLRFKSFLLLTEVDADRAPFVYVVGSHEDAAWREPYEWGYHTQGPEGAIIPPEAAREIVDRHGYEERTFTGRPGDLIIADTRGIHRGNVLRTGERLLLVDLHVMNGSEEAAQASA